MKVDLPNRYYLQYPEENKKYYNNSQSIKTKLLHITSNYCMYCGKLMVIEGDDYSQLEHSVDKMGNYNQSSDETFLTHCKYNFSVACPKCNMSYKKKVIKSDLRPYREKKCLGTRCSEPCSEYIELKNKYCRNNHIILQPLGYSLNGVDLGVSYNVFQHYYEPSAEPDTEAFFLTEDHIARFELNGKRISLSIIEICEEIVTLFEQGVRNFTSIVEILEKKTYMNVIGELFIQTIKDTYLDPKYNIDDLISFFKLLIILSEVY